MSVVIVSAKRTAIGTFGGTLQNSPAAEFTGQLCKTMIEEIGLDVTQVDEVIIGNVLTAGQGQNPARQVSINAGLPESVSSFTLNKVCGSGMKAVMLAAQAIKAGDADCIIAGGMENMSAAPYYLDKQRWGAKLGHINTEDSIIRDGLWDAFNDYHMGITAENLVEKYALTRASQDEFAAASQQKAGKAIEAGKFVDEIVPLTIKVSRKKEVTFDTDEFPRPETTAESLGKLRPCFKKEGSVTAGNASGINDGAALMIIMSAEKAEALGLEVLAEISGYASAGLDPEIMGLGPVNAIQKLTAKTGVSLDDIELFELNEAFASQSLAVVKELQVPTEKVNVNGGAIALGHPIGASGARIMVTLIHEMKRQGLKKGIASLCIGGGQGTAVLINR